MKNLRQTDSALWILPSPSEPKPKNKTPQVMNVYGATNIQTYTRARTHIYARTYQNRLDRHKFSTSPRFWMRGLVFMSAPIL